MKQDKNIDEQISRLLKDHEAQPALPSFDAILDKLEKKKRRRFFWIFFNGLGLTGGLCLLYFLASPSKGLIHEKQFIAQQNNKTITDKTRANTKSLPALKQPGIQKQTQNYDPGALSRKAIQTTTEDNAAHNNQNPAHENDQTKKQLSVNALVIAPAISPQRKYVNDNMLTPAEEQIKKSLTLNNNAVQTVYNALVEEPVYLKPISPVLLSDTGGITLHNAGILSFNTNDSAIKKVKRPYQFYFGISLTPQAGNYFAHENKSRNSIYTPAITQDYLKEKKDQATFRFAYAFGLRAGLTFKDRWEFLLGLGYQQYNYYEKYASFSTTFSNVTYNSPPSTDPLTGNYKNTIHYISYSIAAARIIRLKSLIKIKAGIGLQLNQFWRANTNVTSSTVSDNINKTVFTPHIKLGLVYDVSKRIQLQLCPDLYYSANSVFSKTYAIHQNAYGVGLEGALLFKIGK